MNTQHPAQTDAALLVELTVTNRPHQYRRVMHELRQRGWAIVSTPRDHEFHDSSDSTRSLSSAQDSRLGGVHPAEVGSPEGPSAT
jgi:hypothetical protein